MSCDQGRFVALVPLMCGRYCGPLSFRLGTLHKDILEGPEATAPFRFFFLFLKPLADNFQRNLFTFSLSLYLCSLCL